jgi:putative phage-type endonuclease
MDANLLKAREELETLTRGQSGSSLWFKAREARLTASNFHNICTCKDKQSTAKTLKYRTASPDALNEAMRYGRNCEEFVFKTMCEKFRDVRQCGFYLHPRFNFIGATPDGLVGNDSVLEIKCLHKLRGSDQRPDWLMVEDGLFKLVPTHKYYYQIQGEMMCAGRGHCILAVYHQTRTLGCQIYTVFVERDKKFIAAMLKKLILFWVTYYQSATP